LGGLPIYKEAWENRDSFSWTNHNQFADREFFYLLGGQRRTRWTGYDLWPNSFRDNLNHGAAAQPWQLFDPAAEVPGLSLALLTIPAHGHVPRERIDELFNCSASAANRTPHHENF